MTDNLDYVVVVSAFRRRDGVSEVKLATTSLVFDNLNQLIEWADDADIIFDRKEVHK